MTQARSPLYIQSRESFGENEEDYSCTLDCTGIDEDNHTRIARLIQKAEDETSIFSWMRHIGERHHYDARKPGYVVSELIREASSDTANAASADMSDEEGQDEQQSDMASAIRRLQFARRLMRLGVAARPIPGTVEEHAPRVSQTRHEPILADYPVKPLLTQKEKDEAQDLCTCGACGLSWDDAVGTSLTPAPAARCPFEYFHIYED